MDNPQLKLAIDNFEVEYEILPIEVDSRRSKIYENINRLDEKIEINLQKIEELNTEIDRLTNHADGVDYAVAVVSGIIVGLIDSFFVGETEIDKEKIRKVLEEKYHASNDNAFTHKNKDGTNISSPMYHRLDDLAHHPTLLGLVASILSRYLRLVIYIDGSDGKPHIFFSGKNPNPEMQKLEKEQLIKAWAGAVIGGLFIWLANMAEKKAEEICDGNLPNPLKNIINVIGKTPMVIEMLKAVDSWLGHMMSDVSTSQGIPGIFLSLLKEFSVLPIIRDTNLPVIVDKLYREGEHNLSEWGGIVFVAAKKQAIPVLINELLIRGFYFVRRLITEYREHKNFKDIDWNNVIPFGNRTTERMMTIATGTFTIVDMMDAAIRSIIESGGINPETLRKFLLKVNFVGVGRFAIAVVTDIGMGIKRSNKRNERMAICNEQIHLLNAKVFYYEADMWISAESAGKSMEELYSIAENSIRFTFESIAEIEENMDKIDTHLEKAEQNNPGLMQDMLDILNWG